ncbi:MAG: two-component regulator propeller domain-containing protein [Bacteroidota bacterium]
MKGNFLYHKSFFTLPVLLWLVLSWSLFTTSTSVYAQSLDIKFGHLTTKEGLSQSRVYSILQDKQGFMWFGTWDGLNKYDGYKFTVYNNNPFNSSSISSDRVVDILEDRKGNIWVATVDRGLNKFDKNTDTFIQYKTDNKKGNGLSNVNLNSLFEDSQGNIWIGTQGGGLNKLDPQRMQFTHYLHDPANSNSLIDNEVTDIREDKQGNLWVGTTKGGLDLFDREKNIFIHHQHQADRSNSLSSNFIKCIFEDSKENLWIGTGGGGLDLLDKQHSTFTHYTHHPTNKNTLCHNVVMSIGEDAEGRLWIGTENGGLSIFDYQNNLFYPYKPITYDPNSLNSPSLYSIYQDRQQNMWVGTYSGGVNLYNRNRKQFASFQSNPSDKNSLNQNYVFAFVEDKNANVWVGTDGGGINIFNPKKGSFTHFKEEPGNANSLGGNFVTGMIVDKQNNIWVSGWEAGVTRINPEWTVFKRFQNDPLNPGSLSSNNVKAICEDMEGNIWIGTHRGGVNLLDKKTNQFIHYKHEPNDAHSLGNNYITCVFADSRNNLWFGTEGAGLDLYNRKHNNFIHFFSNEGSPKAISNNYVNSLFEDSKGNLWIATGSGLNMFNYSDSTFSTYRQRDGLPGNTINSMQEDAHGNLWISTNNGLCKFNHEASTYKVYSVEDGLQGNEFTIASLKSYTGELYFGGPNGFNIFQPDSIKDNPVIPPVLITNFQIFNKDISVGSTDYPLKKSISETREITLSYKQSVFSFEFAALNFTSPEKNQYAYKMVGFDKNWNYVGNKRSATYTNLDPGEYTFRVIASNNDGVWNMKGTSIKLIITPPYWKTWWFRVAAVLAVAGAALGLYWYRINAIQDQKKQLEGQNEELKKINAELDRFVYRASHDLRAPLTSILGLINITKTEPNESSKGLYLGLMEKSVHKLDTFIQNIIDYSKNARTEVVSKQIDFESLVWETFEDLKYMDESTQIEKVIQIHGNAPFYSDPFRLKIIFNNMISNAIRYRNPKNASFIKINVEVNAQRALLTFTDNGCGIPVNSLDKIFDMFYRASQANVGSGLGLYIVKEVITTMKGGIHVQSVLGYGTTFVVELPSSQAVHRETTATQANLIAAEYQESDALEDKLVSE